MSNRPDWLYDGSVCWNEDHLYLLKTVKRVKGKGWVRFVKPSFANSTVHCRLIRGKTVDS